MTNPIITTLSEHDPVAIETAVCSADGIIIEDKNAPETWYAVTLALEKYGKPVVFIATGDSATFAAHLNHPLLKIINSHDNDIINTFFAKHFPTPVDASCEGNVCRI